MRMTASWSGSKRTYRIQVGGAKMRLNGKLPSNHHSDRRRQTLELRRKARLPVHPPSACSGLKALRNTSLAKAASRQAALAFRSLDPFRREPDPGDGTKNGLPGRVEDWRASWPRYPDRATFPAPSTSHAACGFPALRAPICFTSGLIGPIIPGQLSVRRVALDSC